MSIYGEKFKIMNDHQVSQNAKLDSILAKNSEIEVNNDGVEALLTTGNASHASIDGKVTACNTGAVVVASSALPTGASSEATLSALSAKVTACDTGAVVVASSALPSGASSEATLSALSAKVTACNTGGVVVASSALPAGASSEATLSALNTKVTACNTGGVVVASSALPSGASSEATLSALSAKVTAVDTGAVVVASSALPTGASDSAKQDEIKVLIGATNTALAGTLSVSAPAPVKTASTPIGSGSLQAINGQSTHTSAEIDLGTARHITFFGDSSDTASSHEVDLLVSDSSGGTYYKTAHSGIYNAGNVHVLAANVPYRYVKLRIKNGASSGSADFRLHLIHST